MCIDRRPGILRKNLFFFQLNTFKSHLPYIISLGGPWGIDSHEHILETATRWYEDPVTVSSKPKTWWKGEEMSEWASSHGIEQLFKMISEVSFLVWKRLSSHMNPEFKQVSQLEERWTNIQEVWTEAECRKRCSNHEQVNLERLQFGKGDGIILGSSYLIHNSEPTRERKPNTLIRLLLKDSRGAWDFA